MITLLVIYAIIVTIYAFLATTLYLVWRQSAIVRKETTDYWRQAALERIEKREEKQS